MGNILRKVWRAVCVFWGVMFAITGLFGAYMCVTDFKIENVLVTVICVVFALLLLRKRKPKSANAGPVQAVTPHVQVIPRPEDTPVDAYVSSGNMIYRTDGKPIEDREVPYLIEMGLREQLAKPVGAPADATVDELKFFAALDAALLAAGKPRDYKVTRMSNGVLSVSSSRAYLGKIKLKGRKTWMQYIKRSGNPETVGGLTLDEYIALISRWVKSA